MEEEYEVFNFKIPKLPKVIRRKLGREAAWGFYNGIDIIEIDERLKGLKELKILIHEMDHAIFPEMSENDVIKHSEIMATFLWKHHYRKVDNEEK